MNRSLWMPLAATRSCLMVCGTTRISLPCRKVVVWISRYKLYFAELKHLALDEANLTKFCEVNPKGAYADQFFGSSAAEKFGGCRACTVGHKIYHSPDGRFIGARTTMTTCIGCRCRKCGSLNCHGPLNMLCRHVLPSKCFTHLKAVQETSYPAQTASILIADASASLKQLLAGKEGKKTKLK